MLIKGFNTTFRASFQFGSLKSSYAISLNGIIEDILKVKQ